jgi:hypothetical protein
LGGVLRVAPVRTAIGNTLVCRLLEGYCASLFEPLRSEDSVAMFDGVDPIQEQFPLLTGFLARLC